jgi:hypothetical protein
MPVAGQAPYGCAKTMHTAWDACSTTSRGARAAGRPPGAGAARVEELAVWVPPRILTISST